MAVAIKRVSRKEADFEADFERLVSHVENAFVEARKKMTPSEIAEADRKINDLCDESRRKPQSTVRPPQ